MIKSLLASLVLVVIAVVVGVLPSLAVVRLLYRIVAQRSRPALWLLLFVATLAWCAAAVWSANAFLTMGDVASSPPGGGGITDPISVVVILGAMTIAVGMWLILLAPSFPALVTLLIVHPNIPLRAKVRAGLQRFWTHPWRNVMLAVGGIALAVLLRAATWWLTGY